MQPETFVFLSSFVLLAFVGWVVSAVALVSAKKRVAKNGGRTSVPLYAEPLKPIVGLFLGAKPKVPRVKVERPFASGRIALSWTCASTSAWNDDRFEVELKDDSSEGFLRCYSGEEEEYTVRNLPEGRELSFRVRCVNQSGRSAWSDVVTGRTTWTPTSSCGGNESGRQASASASSAGRSESANDADASAGGEGEGAGVGSYVWNQNNEFVEIGLQVPKASTNKTLRICVTANTIKVECLRESRTLLQGSLYRPVKASDLVDWTWELESSGSAKVLKIELEKTFKSEKRSELWPQVIVGHKEFDVTKMKWDPAWEEKGWEHILRSEAMRTERMKTQGMPSLQDLISSAS